MNSASDSKSLTRIRALFKEELRTNPELYHPLDIERVFSDDWQIQRFIQNEPDGVEWNAFKALCRTLQWKQRIGLHQLTDQHFPESIRQLNELSDQRSEEGVLIQWEVSPSSKLVKEYKSLLHKHFIYSLEQLDQRSAEHGFILIVNSFLDQQYGKLELEYLHYQLEIIQHFYPGALKAMYLVNQSWLLSAMVRVYLFAESKLKHKHAEQKSLVKCIRSEEVKSLVQHLKVF